MSFNIRLEVEGVPIVVRSFNRLGERLEDLRPVWDEGQKTFWRIEAAQFKSEGARGASGKWKPLTRPYAKQKAKRWGVQPILRASGALEASLTGDTTGTVLLKNPQEFNIGTSIPYAKYHQTGGGRLPKRPVIDFSDETKRDFMKGIQRDLLTEIKRDKAINLDVN